MVMINGREKRACIRYEKYSVGSRVIARWITVTLSEKKKLGFLVYYKAFYQSMYIPEVVAGMEEAALVEEIIKKYQSTVKIRRQENEY